jgi:hypothetical protein
MKKHSWVLNHKQSSNYFYSEPADAVDLGLLIVDSSIGLFGFSKQEPYANQFRVALQAVPSNAV